MERADVSILDAIAEVNSNHPFIVRQLAGEASELDATRKKRSGAIACRCERCKKAFDARITREARDAIGESAPLFRQTCLSGNAKAQAAVEIGVAQQRIVKRQPGGFGHALGKPDLKVDILR
jgi:predicted adenine nucleotide alpha hydrolase (AANH) superfamily ATPase